MWRRYGARDRWGRTWPSLARLRQQLEAAYQQTAGAIAGLYEFAPQSEVVETEVAENGQTPVLELAKA